MGSALMEYMSLGELFDKLKPRTGELSYNFVISLVESPRTCTGCKKKLRVGSYSISLRLQRSAYCSQCASSLHYKGQALVTPKVKKLKASSLSTYDKAYRKFVVAQTLKGHAYYKEPLEALQGVQKYLFVQQNEDEVTVSLNDSSERYIITVEEHQLGLYYVLLRILNTNSKHTYLVSQPFGSYMMDGSLLHVNSYIEDVYCPLTLKKLRGKSLYTTEEGTVTVYESPVSWGKVYKLLDYNRLIVE